MVAATSRRSRAKNVSKEAIDQARVALQELPEKARDNLSLRKAVEQLRDQIEAALSKGYSYDDVAAALTQQGIEIRATTLKQYIPSGGRRSSRKRSGDTAKTGRTRRKKETADQSSALEELSAASTPEPAASESTEEATPAPSRKRGRTAAAKADTAVETPVEATNGKRPSRAKAADGAKSSRRTASRGRKQASA